MRLVSPIQTLVGLFGMMLVSSLSLPRAEAANGSCAVLPDLCGPNRDESCCATREVPRSEFYQEFYYRLDGSGTFSLREDRAIVSPFRLDRFEVAVGRFKAFIDAVIDRGWQPQPGSGKHRHLADGNGLSVPDAPAGYESGWNTDWPRLPQSRAEWQASLTSLPCRPGFSTINSEDEGLPINCVNWYQAFAFCIFDDGFLPTLTEWSAAKVGGEEQRWLPWSAPAHSREISADHASFNCQTDGCSIMDIKPAGTYSPQGDGRFGHAELAGNLAELVLGRWGWGFPELCVDCAADYNHATEDIVLLQATGGGFSHLEHQLSGLYTDDDPDLSVRDRRDSIGFRCAYPN